MKRDSNPLKHAKNPDKDYGDELHYDEAEDDNEDSEATGDGEKKLNEIICAARSRSLTDYDRGACKVTVLSFYRTTLSISSYFNHFSTNRHNGS